MGDIFTNLKQFITTNNDSIKDHIISDIHNVIYNDRDIDDYIDHYVDNSKKIYYKEAYKIYLKKESYITDFIEFYEYLERINKNFSKRTDGFTNSSFENIRIYINNINDIEQRIICIESLYLYYTYLILHNNYLNIEIFKTDIDKLTTHFEQLKTNIEKSKTNDEKQSIYNKFKEKHSNYVMTLLDHYLINFDIEKLTTDFEQLKTELSDKYNEFRNENNKYVMELLNHYSINSDINSNIYTDNRDGLQHINSSIQKHQKHNKEYISTYKKISEVRKSTLDRFLITIIIIFVSLGLMQYNNKKLMKIYVLIFLIFYYILYRYQIEGFQGVDLHLNSLIKLELTLLEYLELKSIYIFLNTNINNGIQKEFHKYSKFDEIVKNRNLKTKNEINNLHQSIHWWKILNECLILFFIGFILFYLILDMIVVFTVYIVIVLGYTIYRYLQKSRTQYGKNYW